MARDKTKEYSTPLRNIMFMLYIKITSTTWLDSLALLTEDSSRLEVGKKRDGKDYEITEHTTVFVLSEYAS